MSLIDCQVRLRILELREETVLKDVDLIRI